MTFDEQRLHCEGEAPQGTRWENLLWERESRRYNASVYCSCSKSVHKFETKHQQSASAASIGSLGLSNILPNLCFSKYKSFGSQNLKQIMQDILSKSRPGSLHASFYSSRPPWLSQLLADTHEVSITWLGCQKSTTTPISRHVAKLTRWYSQQLSMICQVWPVKIWCGFWRWNRHLTEVDMQTCATLSFIFLDTETIAQHSDFEQFTRHSKHIQGSWLDK